MQLRDGFKIAALLVASCVLVTQTSAKKTDSEILDELKKYERCVYEATFTFVKPDFYPPRTQADLDRTCKRTTDGIKCLRERTKGAEPLIRRGLVSLAGTRARQSKRVCTNSSTNNKAGSFLAATRCLMDKRLNELQALETKLIKTMAAIPQRNYNDSAPELKQICCALHDFKQGSTEVARAACPEHRAMVEEFMSMVVSDDMALICDDTDKLNQTCPQLERVPIDKIPQVGAGNSKMPSSSVTVLYLFATLGEASETPLKFD